MKLLFLAIIFISQVQASECSRLIRQFSYEIFPPDKRLQHVDWPVEKYFPNVQIRNGYIPKSSRAFIVWRQNTSPWIPDDAFAFHYMTRNEVAAELGFIVPETTEHLASRSIHLHERLSPAAQSFLEDYYKRETEQFLFPVNMTAYKPKTVANNKYGSVEAMFDQLSIDFHLNATKWQAMIDNRVENVRWLVTGDGRAFLWSDHEGKILLDATEMPGNHGDILALFADSSSMETKKAPMIAFGFIDFSSGVPVLDESIASPFAKGKSGNFDFLAYLKEYFNH